MAFIGPLIITAFFLSLILIIIRLWLDKKKDKNYRAKYPSSYTCLDGDRVRSLSEVIVDNCLFRHRINHKGEDLIVKNADKKYKYDWYLPDINVYLEFFGYSGKKYHETRELKEKFYKKHHLKMIPIEPTDLVNIDQKLKEKLGKDWKKVAKERFCPNCGKTLDERI